MYFIFVKQKKDPNKFKIDSPQIQQQGPPQLIRRVSKRNVAIRDLASEAKPTENFEKLIRQMTPQDQGFVITCLKQHFVFSSLSETQLSTLAKAMFYCHLKKDQIIINQGDAASSFFILEKGKIRVLVDGQERKILEQGNGFGELALLYNAPRSATCTAIDECYLWGIDRQTFRKSVEDIMRQEQEANRKYLEQVKFFNQLTREQKDAIAGVLIRQKFNKDQIIVNEGDQASSFYIIAEGQVGVFNKDSQQIATLNANESFGESALKAENQVRQMTIKAVQPDTKVLALGRDIIQQILGDQVQSIIYKNICKWAMHNSKLFSVLPIQKQEKLLEGVQFRKINKLDKIISKGDKVGLMIVLLDGNAVGEDKHILAKKGDILLYDKAKNEKHIINIYAENDLNIGIIDYGLFREQQGSVEKIVEGQKQNDQNSSAAADLIKSYKIEDLIYLTKLGSGQFGSVYLCKFKNLDQLFALKYVTRAHVVQFGIQKHIQQEKSVLELMDHQNILKFYRSYKDKENIYFLTEFIPGMELFDAIRVIGLLGKAEAQFYCAQMILMMEYLHTIHQIVYRDIKPENIMVDDSGYLKLIDMGTAKSFKNTTTSKTFTIIGTPHYMAPEVISGKGYGYTADLWSVGVCLYEFICGGLPFGEEAEDPFEIYKEIIKKPIQYPGYMADKTAKPFIEQLLNKIPEIRLGGSYTTIKANPWFKDLSWDQLLQKKLKAPFQPPKDKLITPEQVRQLGAKNTSVLEQIKVDTAGSKKVFATEKDAEWDHIF
ncbi:hypothetical protein pb186bvf_019842 [Paramecium bursaria]